MAEITKNLMVTEPEKNEPKTPHLDEGDGNVDPERLAAVRMPTGFLKWVLSTPLPKEDKEDLWLDTLPPGSKIQAPPPKRKALPPWVFVSVVTFFTAAILTGLVFLLMGQFESTREKKPNERASAEAVPPAARPTAEASGPDASEKASKAVEAEPDELEEPDAAPEVKQPPKENAHEAAAPEPVKRPKASEKPSVSPKSSPTEQPPVRSKPSLFEME